MIDKIIAYEQGELSEDEIIELFQDLVNTGMAWRLQGHYGRMAKYLIDSGLVHDVILLQGEGITDDPNDPAAFGGIPVPR